MAAAFKALNARIRSNPYLDYFCSTHFWGPVSNFGIPLAAIADMKKDPELISGKMTPTLAVYSAIFARYSMAITPKNYLLLLCHLTNFTSQCVQGYRYTTYWHMGGRDQLLAEQQKLGTKVGNIADKAKDVAAQTGDKFKQALSK